MAINFDTLGKTDREIARHREAEERSRAAFSRSWKILFVDLDTDTACRLYDAIGRSRAANARQIVLDLVPGSHFIALTDCPLAYLKMEGARVGLSSHDVSRMVDDENDALDTWRSDIDALEAGQAAPSAINYP